MEASLRMVKNAACSRALAAESMVLLKNIRNTLLLLGTEEEPIKLAVFGVGQIYTVKGGTGSGNVNNLKTISLLEGLTQCRPENTGAGVCPMRTFVWRDSWNPRGTSIRRCR